MNKQPARRALGRGLSNLIPAHIEGDESVIGDEIQFIDISLIKTNPFQPRIDFDDEEIKRSCAKV